MPDNLVPYIMGTPLMPIRRPDGGVRPIAVGETLNRIVSSIAMSRVKTQAKHPRRPLQVGVATRTSTDTKIHGVRTWLDNLGDSGRYGMLQLGMRSAF